MNTIHNGFHSPFADDVETTLEILEQAPLTLEAFGTPRMIQAALQIEGFLHDVGRANRMFPHIVQPGPQPRLALEPLRFQPRLGF